jgi:hypothetical protein
VKRLALGLSLWFPLACATTASEVELPVGMALPGCSYDVKLVSAKPALLEVDVTCMGREVAAFVASERASLPNLSDVRDAKGNELERDKNVFRLNAPSTNATLHYRLDLEALAEREKAMDVALRQGRTLIAPGSTWLLRPEPSYDDLPVRVNVEVPPGESFTTGIRHSKDHYSLLAHEISVSTYGVFGKFVSKRVQLPGRPKAGLEIVLADGRVDSTEATLFQWVEDSAREVGKFWKGFPVPQTLVILLPVPGRQGVVFGKVLPESAPGVIVMVGENSQRDRLYGDWVLVHELFHLGVPSFNREGKWFDEGLATYYEPLIRARAGWRSEEDVWREFANDMRQGLRAMNRTGLENPADYPDIYWGGAVFCLLADLELRKRSNGKQGLEDGLLGVLAAGGNASEVWPLQKTLSLADKTVGGNAIGSLARSHAKQGKPIDFEGVLRELGVLRKEDGGVTLSNDAPLAAIRKALIFGPSS